MPATHHYLFAPALEAVASSASALQPPSTRPRGFRSARTSTSDTTPRAKACSYFSPKASRARCSSPSSYSSPSIASPCTPPVPYIAIVLLRILPPRDANHSFDHPHLPTPALHLKPATRSSLRPLAHSLATLPVTHAVLSPLVAESQEGGPTPVPSLIYHPEHHGSRCGRW